MNIYRGLASLLRPLGFCSRCVQQRASPSRQPVSLLDVMTTQSGSREAAGVMQAHQLAAIPLLDDELEASTPIHSPRAKKASRRTPGTKVSPPPPDFAAPPLTPELDVGAPAAGASAAASTTTHTPSKPSPKPRSGRGAKRGAPEAGAAKENGLGAGALQQAAAAGALGPALPAPHRRGRLPKAVTVLEASPPLPEDTAPAKRRRGRPSAALATAAAAVMEAPAVKRATAKGKEKGKGKVGKSGASFPAAAIADEGEGEVAAVTMAGRRKKQATKAAVVEGSQDASEVVKVVKKRGPRRGPDPLPFTDPTPELLASLAGYQPPPLPVPNLGYACLNSTLRTLKPPIFTSRDCVKKTLDAKGLPYLGELCLANARDLARIIQWNHENRIRLFRLSSVLFPWMGTFKAEDLPNYSEVKAALRFAGDLARAYDQRLTFHPSHFNKLAAPSQKIVDNTVAELEAHSTILDLMGYEKPSPWNKINIHVGGQYGSKSDTILRFAENFKRLSPACQARLTVENDDVETSYSISDLLELHALTRVPLVFDFHHHRFCPGGMSEKEAFLAAVKTWPQGVRPVVHWSESQPGRKAHAHSDYVKGPILLHGLEGEVDVMIEAKAKEKALLCIRDGLPLPTPDSEEVEVLPDAE